MEDSEKRKERLKAMCMEASAPEQVSSHVETYTRPGFLSNPLIENSTTTMMQESSKTPRFDFYTDPVAAFSGNKNSKASYHIAQAYITPPTHSGSPETRFSPSVQGSINLEMTPPAHQVQQSYYSTGQIHRRPVHYSGFAPYGNPAGMDSPFSMHLGTTPGGWNRPGSIPNYGFPSNARAGTLAPYPVAYGPGVNHGQSRGHWLGTSPKFASGHGGKSSPRRGRGHWHGSIMSLGSGRSGGRGRGFHPRAYNLMVHWGQDDFTTNPWLKTHGSMKKERVPEATNKTSSQPSLAEYLAASFNEAANDAAGV